MIASIGRCESLISLIYFALFLCDFSARCLDTRRFLRWFYWSFVCLWATFAIAGQIFINFVPYDSALNALLINFGWKRTVDLGSREDILLFLWSVVLDLAVLSTSVMAAVSAWRAQCSSADSSAGGDPPQTPPQSNAPVRRHLHPDYIAAQALAAITAAILPCLLVVPYLLFASSAATPPSSNRAAVHRLRAAGAAAALHLLLLFLAQIIDPIALCAAAAGDSQTGSSWAYMIGLLNHSQWTWTGWTGGASVLLLFIAAFADPTTPPTAPPAHHPAPIIIRRRRPSPPAPGCALRAPLLPFVDPVSPGRYDDDDVEPPSPPPPPPPLQPPILPARVAAMLLVAWAVQFPALLALPHLAAGLAILSRRWRPWAAAAAAATPDQTLVYVGRWHVAVVWLQFAYMTVRAGDACSSLAPPQIGPAPTPPPGTPPPPPGPGSDGDGLLAALGLVPFSGACGIVPAAGGGAAGWPACAGALHGAGQWLLLVAVLLAAPPPHSSRGGGGGRIGADEPQREPHSAAAGAGGAWWGGPAGGLQSTGVLRLWPAGVVVALLFLAGVRRGRDTRAGGGWKQGGPCKEGGGARGGKGPAAHGKWEVRREDTHEGDVEAEGGGRGGRGGAGRGGRGGDVEAQGRDVVVQDTEREVEAGGRAG